MFKITLKSVSDKFNIPYRTLQDWNKREDYRKDLIEELNDLFVLESFYKETEKQFEEDEIIDIKLSVKYYFDKEYKNNELLEFISNNNKLKYIVEKYLLGDFKEEDYIKVLLYKIDKYIDRLARYFLLKESLNEIIKIEKDEYIEYFISKDVRLKLIDLYSVFIFKDINVKVLNFCKCNTFEEDDYIELYEELKNEKRIDFEHCIDEECVVFFDSNKKDVNFYELLEIYENILSQI